MFNRSFHWLPLLTVAVALAQPCLDEDEGWWNESLPADTVNGGWSSDPPRFLPLELDGEGSCWTGFLFGFEDPESGAWRQDEDWLEGLALGMPCVSLEIDAIPELPLRLRVTRNGALLECRILRPPYDTALFLRDGPVELGLSLVDGESSPVALWTLRSSTWGTWDPVFPDNARPDLAEPLTVPADVEGCLFGLHTVDTADLDLTTLWRPWQGAFDPLRAAASGEVWYRLELPEPRGLAFSTWSSAGAEIELLVFEAAGDLPGPLRLACGSACGDTSTASFELPAGAWLLALDGTGHSGCGRFAVTDWTPEPCPAPLLQLGSAGADLRLTWSPTAGAVVYRVEAGPAPGALVEVATVEGLEWLDAAALAAGSRFYRVRALCGD